MSPDTPGPGPTREERAAEALRAVLSGEVGLTGLDALVRSAALATWAPVALVSMISDRQVTASAQRVIDPGPLPARGDHVSLAESVCVHALRDDGPVRISDARDDDRVAQLPSVLDGSFRSYLGVPVRLGGGDLVGVLCVYDAAARTWSETEEHELHEVAGRVSLELVRIVSEYAGRVTPDAAAPGPR